MSPKEEDSCKGFISAKECLDALKVMGDGKSPRVDGFTAEFYKFFLEGPQPLLIFVWSIDFSYSLGEMQVTQRSALIATLPEPNKSKFYLKIGHQCPYLGSIIK